jgi:hypothetical protein
MFLLRLINQLDLPCPSPTLGADWEAHHIMQADLNHQQPGLLAAGPLRFRLPYFNFNSKCTSNEH